MTVRWNTPFDDFESLVREVLVGGRPGRQRPLTEPPAELEADYRMATRAVEQLAKRGVGLHFAVEQGSDRVRVQKLDNEGRVIDEISPMQLLEALAQCTDLQPEADG